MITIYHNARCGKSREAFSLLEKKTKKFKVIEYLKEPPTKVELLELIKMLGIKPEALVRKKEPVFEEKFKSKKLSDAQWIRAMVKYPILIERPIVVNGDTAIICRPPEKVLEFLKYALFNYRIITFGLSKNILLWNFAPKKTPWVR